MQASDAADLTPEAKHLRDQEDVLARLTDELADKEADFAATGAAFAQFRVTYMRRFAPLYAELDRLEAEIAVGLATRMRSDTEAARTAQQRAAEAEARAEESASAAEGAARDREAPAERSPELKALYRQVSKAVHPDLAGDDTERARRTRLMAAASEAHASGDESALLRILADETARPEDVAGDDVGSRLIRTLRKIAQVRRRLTELMELESALPDDPMWTLFDTVADASRRGHDTLREVEKDLERRIRSAKAQLAALTEPPAPSAAR